MRFRDWQLGLILVGILAFAAVLIVVLRPDSGSSSPTPGAAASIVLGDPLPWLDAESPVTAPKLEVKRPEVVGKATSGDREKATAAKNELKKRVLSGKGTDMDARMLRALCRQLGDMSCVN